MFATLLAALAVALPAPGHLHVSARSMTSVTLSWSGRGRRFELRRPGHPARRLRAGARRVRVGGLRPGRRYRLGIRACAASSCGRTAWITARTRAAGTASGDSIGGWPRFPADNPLERGLSPGPV